MSIPRIFQCWGFEMEVAILHDMHTVRLQSHALLLEL
jgi:hypothetical protein